VIVCGDGLGVHVMCTALPTTPRADGLGRFSVPVCLRQCLPLKLLYLQWVGTGRTAELNALKAEIIAAVQDTVKGLATQEALSALTTNVTTIQETVNTIMETVAETKEDMTAVKEDIQEFRTEVHAGFSRVENLLLAKQEQRINDLETRMKNLEDALAV
jgi:hypothetical protein